MVYNTKTLQVLHSLTKDGELKYSDMLEAAADELLFKAQHPVKWLIRKIMGYFKR